MALYGFGLLAGCASEPSLTGGYADQVEPWHLADVAEKLQQQLQDVDPGPIIFGTKNHPTQREAETLARFSNALPNGRFIFGGSPTYWLNYTKKEVREQPDIYTIEYRVELIHSRTASVIANASQFGVCRRSDPLFFSHPKPCRLMRPLIFQRALENL